MDIVSHNSAFLRQKGRFRMVSAASATISVSWCEQFHQICQVGYMADGSIRVQWPYLAVSQGTLAEARLPENQNGPATVNLLERGRFTSQLVKFSHHVSGIAQFSLTGRVRSDVRRQSFQLTGPIGRIFELSAWEPQAFRPLARLKSQRVYINFEVGDSPPAAIQIRGEWRRKADLVANSRPRRGVIGPFGQWIHRATGEGAPVAFFGPPLHCPLQDHVLCITCHPAPRPNGASRAGLVFLGGFDPHEQSARETDVPIRLTRFLAAMYPTSSSDEVQKAIGSIDLVQQVSAPETAT